MNRVGESERANVGLDESRKRLTLAEKGLASRYSRDRRNTIGRSACFHSTISGAAERIWIRDPTAEALHQT